MNMTTQNYTNNIHAAQMEIERLQAENANLKFLLTRCKDFLGLAELEINPKDIAGYERDMNNIKIALYELGTS